MRHVPNEADFACIAANDLGPLVPSRGAAAGHEEIKEGIDPVPPAKADEGADRPGLIRRVVDPGALARRSLAEFGPVTFERGLQHCVVEFRLLVPGVERDGRRGWIEIAKARRARNITDLPVIARGDDCRAEIQSKLSARGGKPGSFRTSQNAAERVGVAKAPKGPKIIPQAVLRLSRISLVTDRTRHQAEVKAGPGVLDRARTLGQPQLVHIAGRRKHVRPFAL